MRAAIFHPAAREAIHSFPESVAANWAKPSSILQRGAALGMLLSRPMPSIASGAAELRIRDRSGIYRALYYTSSPQGILVFHAFMKKTPTAPKQDLDLGKKRLKELLHEEV